MRHIRAFFIYFLGVKIWFELGFGLELGLGLVLE